MKSFYKIIFVFIILVFSHDNLFAQQIAVGPYLSYGFINKNDFKNAKEFIAGGMIYFERKKHLSFISGLLYSRRYYYANFRNPDPPYFQNPNSVNAGYPYYYPKDANIINKTLFIPFKTSYTFLNRHSFSLYGLSGLNLGLRLNQFSYGKQFIIYNSSTIADAPDYNKSDIYSNESKYKFQDLNFEVAAGTEIILFDKIKTGIEAKQIFTLFDYYNYRCFSLSLFAKYYFNEIKRPKK